MYKLFITNLIIALLGVPMLAATIDLGYYQTKTTHIKTFNYGTSYKKGALDVSTALKWKDTTAGYSYVAAINADYDYTNTNDFFMFGTFTKDTVLGIENRIDLGVGLGYYFVKAGNTKHKISYAVILRENRGYHSFRYKYNYDAKFFDAKLTCFYTYPDKEFSSTAKTSLKVFKNLAIGLNNEYKFRKDLEDYLTYAFIKVSL